MVEVVMPLRIHGVPSPVARVNDANIFKIAFRDQPGLTVKPAGLIGKTFRKFIENMTSTEIVDAMDCVQTEGIDVEFGKPVKGIVDNEAANPVALRPVKVDCPAPWRVMSVGEAG